MKRIRRLKTSIICVLMAFVFSLSETPVIPTSAATTVVHNFTTNGKNSSFFTIVGNLSTTKGTVTYKGMTLTQCLKIETSTSIEFTTSGTSTLTLVFNNGENKRIKIDGQNHTMVNGIVTTSLGAGTHRITKTDVANLYYIEMVTDGSSPNPTPTPTPIPGEQPNPGSGDIILTPNGSMTLQQAVNSIQAGKTIY